MLARGLGAALALAACGCGSAVNYLDPAGPVYVTSHPGPVRPAVPGAPFRVVTFNIDFGIEVDRAIEVLRRTEPLRSLDALALQEMDAPGTERIARALGMNSVYFPSGVHPKHGRDMGCAVLSPWPLEEPRKLLLPHAARVNHLQRAVTSAVVVRGSERVRVYSVHLPSPPAESGGSRREQLRVLAADANAVPGPVVIAGDFNSHDKVEELARAGFTWLTRDEPHTTEFSFLGLGLGGAAYDHILVRGLESAPGDGAVGVVADNRGASDHKPVWAVVVAEGRRAAR
ncbi:MAG TPA: endonuclease/exonuclease/phosphatase family protein [Vicinamibacteria bacterium]|nr:endonuclease/exonuclease/phosphatase family protein [Vicinamibacteria bacterium]